VLLSDHISSELYDDDFSRTKTRYKVWRSACLFIHSFGISGRSHDQETISLVLSGSEFYLETVGPRL
jgi:hypothetical protein